LPALPAERTNHLKRPALFPLVATGALVLGAIIAGCGGGGGGGGGTGPPPTNPPSTPTPTPTPGPVASGPQAGFTPRGGSVTRSSYSIQSNPAGLTVTVTVGTPPPTVVCSGTTPTTCNPSFSNASYQIAIDASGGNYVFVTDQSANGSHTVFYNKPADTNGSIGSVSPTSVTRSAQSVVHDDTAGVPRFGPFSSAGLPVYSSTRVAVHYRISSLQAAGRRAQDVESFERVSRAVDIGFKRGDQITRIVNVPNGTDTAALIARLKSHGEVVDAEPLQLRYKQSMPQFLPNDVHFAQTDGTFPAMYEQWDMYRIGAPNAWSYTQGTPQTGNTPNPSTCSITTGSAPTPNPGVVGIAIAILDTGFDNNHADLAGGKVVYGEKVIGGVVTCGVAAAQDTDGHGTNVSGIAGANTNNNFGFAGVGFNVSLQEYKIFPDGPSPSADTGDESQAIYDAVAHGARVISLSLGGGQATGFDPVERDAIEYAISKNVAVVAAAGNEATSGTTTLDFPAGYDGVISVGATTLNDAPNYKQYATATDAVALYSNSGPRLTIVAPGGDPPACESVPTTPNCPGYPGTVDALHWVYNIYTTTPFNVSQHCSNIADCKALFAGTSQATPHVAGAVALLLSKNPALTVAQVTQILESTADDIGDAKQGHGRLNLYRAMAVVAGDNAQPGNGGLPIPTNINFVAIVYNNPGGTRPTIVNQTYPKGVPVASNGTFRLGDIPSGFGTVRCAVWADVNGDGIVDAGDWFGSAGTSTGFAPCTAASAIVAHPVGAGFTLP
jgi:subtilisin family serine protease